MNKFWNPFEFIAGWQALAAGAAGLVVSAVVASLTDQSFNGMLHVRFAEVTFWQSLVQQGICWLLLATLLYAAALIFSRSSVRALDIYGTMLFAQIPLTLMVASAMIILPELGALATRPVEELIAYIQSHPIPVMLYGVLVVVLLVWYFMWSYRAFSVSANMRGERAVAIFIVCCLVSWVAAGPILQLIG